MKLELYQGKLCCSHCHHLISTEGEAEESCPYCKKKLTREEIEHWAQEEKNREIVKREFKSPPLGAVKLPEHFGLDLSKIVRNW